MPATKKAWEEFSEYARECLLTIWADAGIPPVPGDEGEWLSDLHSCLDANGLRAVQKYDNRDSDPTGLECIGRALDADDVAAIIGLRKAAGAPILM